MTSLCRAMMVVERVNSGPSPCIFIGANHGKSWDNSIDPFDSLMRLHANAWFFCPCEHLPTCNGHICPSLTYLALRNLHVSGDLLLKKVNLVYLVAQQEGRGQVQRWLKEETAVMAMCARRRWWWGGPSCKSRANAVDCPDLHHDEVMT